MCIFNVKEHKGNLLSLGWWNRLTNYGILVLILPIKCWKGALVQQGFITYTFIKPITFPNVSLEIHRKATNVVKSTFYGFFNEYCLYTFLYKQSKRWCSSIFTYLIYSSLCIKSCIFHNYFENVMLDVKLKL